MQILMPQTHLNNVYRKNPTKRKVKELRTRKGSLHKRKNNNSNNRRKKVPLVRQMKSLNYSSMNLKMNNSKILKMKMLTTQMIMTQPRNQTEVKIQIQRMKKMLNEKLRMRMRMKMRIGKSLMEVLVAKIRLWKQSLKFRIPCTARTFLKRSKNFGGFIWLIERDRLLHPFLFY